MNREPTSEARVRMCPPAIALAIPQGKEAKMRTRKAEAPHNDALRVKLRLLPCIFDDRPIVVLLLRDIDTVPARTVCEIWSENHDTRVQMETKHLKHPNDGNRIPGTHNPRLRIPQRTRPTQGAYCTPAHLPCRKLGSTFKSHNNQVHYDDRMRTADACWNVFPGIETPARGQRRDRYRSLRHGPDSLHAY
jgi:hypothetical protein